MNLYAKSDALSDLPERDILGVQVTSVDWNDAIALLCRLIREKTFTKIGFLNAHSANIAYVDPDFATALADFVVLPDGVGVDMAGRLLHGAPFPANLNGTDFVPAVLQAMDPPQKVALIGAKRANVEAAAKKLSRLASHHSYVVIDDGFFSPDEEAAVVGRIAATRPDILLVAMGVPRQEMWIHRWVTEGHCTMAIGVGALFDFLSGAVPRAPYWMRRSRLEWLFRLAVEPGRLWRRYILGNPLFLLRVLRQKLRQPEASA